MQLLRETRPRREGRCGAGDFATRAAAAEFGDDAVGPGIVQQTDE
jgi:hypothetical protein